MVTRAARPVGGVPLCSGGRCEAIMRKLVEGRQLQRLAEWQGEQMAAVIVGTLRRLGHDPGTAEVQAALDAEIASRLDGQPGRVAA